MSASDKGVTGDGSSATAPAPTQQPVVAAAANPTSAAKTAPVAPSAGASASKLSVEAKVFVPSFNKPQPLQPVRRSHDGEA